MKLGLPISISVTFWIIAGLLRAFYEETFGKRMYVKNSVIKKKLRGVAVCIPAHNEEKVLERTIKAIKRQVPPKQIFVVSDGSTDKTVEIARKLRCKVIQNMPGKGKARALAGLFKHFKIFKNFEFVLFIDAEVILGAEYLERAMKVFATHPETVAISGYVITPLRKHRKLTKKGFIEAYRVRLNHILQMFLVYGQSWKFVNTTVVIPGGCSIYRTNVLKKIRIDTPGLLIEDFNLTFQIHKYKLGKISHYPNIYIYDQEPQNFRDYWNQVRRWNIGFLQTMRKQGIWPGLFWFLVGIFTIEVFINATLIVLLPATALLLTTQYYAPVLNPQIVTVSKFVSRYYITLWELLGATFVFDYLFTIFTVFKKKKLIILIYGLGFMLFRYIDSLALLASVRQGLLAKSKGRWTPPKRS